jgi:MOSC domain-containing protein YiiM
MPSFDELEDRYRSLTPSGNRGVVRLIVVRLGDGMHETPPSARLHVDHGLEGDRWARGRPPTHASQVTLMGATIAALLAGDDKPLHLAGDNFLVDIDLGTEALPPGARVRLGSAVLEVTDKPHLGCKKFSERFGEEALRWVNWPEHRDRRLRGVNCRIVAGGAVSLGDSVEIPQGRLPASGF